MLYQLPSGRVIYLTVEQFLSLTDEDIQMLVAGRYGEHVSSPFFGSVIHKPKRYSNENPYDKDGLDYEADDEEVRPTNQGLIDPNALPDENIDL